MDITHTLLNATIRLGTDEMDRLQQQADEHSVSVDDMASLLLMCHIRGEALPQAKIHCHWIESFKKHTSEPTRRFVYEQETNVPKTT